MASKSRTAFVQISAYYEGTHARLGWLYSFARKTLLGRHLSRWLSISAQDILAHERGEQLLLELLRICITSQSQNEQTLQLLSAGYEPSNRPEHYYLGVAKRFEKSSFSPVPEKLATFIPDGSRRFVANTKSQDHMFTDVMERVLSDEIAIVLKSTNLSTKSVADERCKKLGLTP